LGRTKIVGKASQINSQSFFKTPGRCFAPITQSLHASGVCVSAANMIRFNSEASWGRRSASPQGRPRAEPMRRIACPFLPKAISWATESGTDLRPRLRLKLGAKTPTRLCAKGQGLRHVSRPITGDRQQGRRAPLSTPSVVEWSAHTQDQQHGFSAAVFLRCDARSSRSREADDVRLHSAGSDRMQA
jgi:hypothetical protein